MKLQFEENEAAVCENCKWYCFLASSSSRFYFVCSNKISKILNQFSIDLNSEEAQAMKQSVQESEEPVTTRCRKVFVKFTILCWSEASPLTIVSGNVDKKPYDRTEV
ncbi:hypothetical protein T459_04427 [Capsicum annuum]|uniref:Uncharacterized protein n=1 Tax=Capsicum annuum TaxID=4072 RepID=A0A2G3A515_CAPAN|nr:hypothetical protein T459_04427 [Capsicum annuum]